MLCPQFRLLSTSSETLFSIINGDDIFAAFTGIETGEFIWWYTRVFVYVFTILFSYIVLNLFIAIILVIYIATQPGLDMDGYKLKVSHTHKV